MDLQIPGQTSIIDAPAGSASLDLEQLIKNHVKAIDDLKDELKKKREMYADSFNNDPTYREHDEKVKEVSKARSSVKQQIAKQPSVAALAQEIKDIRFDLKEKKKTMSDLLLDYREQTGAKQLELFGGQVVEIVQTAKLVNRSSIK